MIFKEIFIQNAGRNNCTLFTRMLIWNNELLQVIEELRVLHFTVYMLPRLHDACR